MRKTGGSETQQRAFRPLLENANVLFLVTGLVLVLTACGTPPPTDRPPVRFTGASATPGGDDFVNWPAPPKVIEAEVFQALREIDREDLEVFGVVAQLEKAQLEKNDSGLLISAPPGKKLNPNSGVVVTAKAIQFGLTKGEIDDLWRRIQEVIAEVDSGTLPVF